MFPSRWVNVPSMACPALLALLAAIRSLLWSRAHLQAEVLALRHQLLVLKRQCAGRRVHFQTSDRVLWSWLSRLWPGWRQGLLLVRPETVVRWHRQGFRSLATSASDRRSRLWCGPRGGSNAAGPPWSSSPA